MKSSVRNILQRKGGTVHNVSPTTSVFDALRLMADVNVGALLVMDEGKLVALAERIIERIEEPILFEGRSCRVSGSAGIAISTSYRLQNPYRMLSDSDLALYASKRGGRGRATVFRPDLVLTNDRRARH